MLKKLLFFFVFINVTMTFISFYLQKQTVTSLYNKKILYISEQLKTEALINSNNANKLSELANENKPLESLVIHNYPRLNKYGFNRGVYDDNLLSGSLIGFGKSPDNMGHELSILSNVDRFTIRNNNLVNISYISAAREYIYLIPKVSFDEYTVSKGLFDLSVNKFEKLHLLNKESLSLGYIFTEPYVDSVSRQMIITIKSPVYKLNAVIGELTIDIGISKLFHSLGVYNDTLFAEESTIVIFNKRNNKSVNLFNDSRNGYIFKSKEINIDSKTSIQVEFTPYLVLNSFFNNHLSSFILWILLNILTFYCFYQHKDKEYNRNSSRIDFLTGLYNRRSLSFDINRLVKDMQVANKPISIIMIDGDKFKSINDKYGHHIGDLALKHISNQISLLSRATDFCIRLGGDEFCIVLLNTTRKEAGKLAFRINKAINITRFCHLEIYISVTTSCVQLNQNETLELAFERADQQLYAKKSVNNK